MSGEIDITPGKLLAPDEGLNNDKLHQILMGLQARLGSESIGERELALGNKAAPNDLLASLLPMVEGGELKAARGSAMPFLPAVSVLRFGAKGDGTADDTSAIQAAQDYCGEHGYRLWFPRGTYLAAGLTTALPIRWSADGAATIKWTGDTGSTTFITVTADVDVDVRGLTFEGYYRGFNLLKIDGGTRTVRFHDCVATDFIKPETGGTGYFLRHTELEESDGARRLEIVGCTFNSIHRAVIWANPADSVLVANNQVHDAWGTVFSIGNNTWDVESAFILNNRLKDVYPRDGYVDFFIKGILVYGKQIIVGSNHIENLYDNDIGPNPNRPYPDSEPIYLKAGECLITNNTLLNAGMGDASIVIKGEYNDTSVVRGKKMVVNNLVHKTEAWYAARKAELGKAFYSSGMWITGGDVVVKDNIITGAISNGIVMTTVGYAAALRAVGNTIKLSGTDGHWVGVYVQEMRTCDVSGNEIEGVDVGIALRIDAAVANTCERARIEGNAIVQKSDRTNEWFSTAAIIRVDARNTGATYKHVYIAGNTAEGTDMDDLPFGLWIRAQTEENEFSAERVTFNGNIFKNLFRWMLLSPLASHSYGVVTIRNGMLIGAGNYFNSLHLPRVGTLELDACHTSNNLGANKVQRSGVATLGSLDTSVDVATGLDSNIDRTNARVLLTPLANLNNATKIWAELADSTTFTIKVDAAPGLDIPVAWEIKSKYHL